MSYTFIYGLFDPRNSKLRYIGKSNNPEFRLNAHIREAKLGHRGFGNHKNNWIKQLVDAEMIPLLEILEKVPSDNWKDYEISWIQRARLSGVKLVNSTEGGEGVKGHTFTEEHKRKLGDAHRGKPSWSKGQPVSIETREKIRKANTGRKHTIEAREKMSKALKGLKRSEEARRKLGERSKGHITSEETKEKLRQASMGNKYGLGYKHTDEARVKISQALKGRTLSEEHKERLKQINRKREVSQETRQKMSEAAKGRIPHNKGKPHSEETRRKISEANKVYQEKKRLNEQL